jgi:hypothetical protein
MNSTVSANDPHHVGIIDTVREPWHDPVFKLVAILTALVIILCCLLKCIFVLERRGRKTRLSRKASRSKISPVDFLEALE